MAGRAHLERALQGSNRAPLRHGWLVDKRVLVLMAIQLPERPIFMLGAERSGTTLIMAMLGCHPRIAVPEVVWYYPRFRPYLHTYGDLAPEENFPTPVDEMAFGLKTPSWG